MGWLKERLPKKRWKRVCVYLLSTAAIVVAGDMVLVRCWRGIEISERTTRIVSPLGADGLPDYAAARNAGASEGVTAENNAAQELLALSAEGQEGQLDFVDWLKAHAAAGTDSVEWENVFRKPWKSSEHPEHVAWLNSQRESLARLDEALRKERFYVPWKSAAAGEVTAEILPWLYHARAMANLLLADAMRAAGDGDSATFRRDVVDIGKLARLTGQGSTLIEYMVAMAISDTASLAVRQGASVAFLRADGARLLLKEWRALPPMPDGSGVFDVGERYLALNAFCRASKIGLRGALGGEADRMGVLVVPVHYNVALRKFNRFFDALVAAERMPDYKRRSEAIQAVVAESAHPGWLSIADLLLAVQAPSIGRTFVMQERAIVGRDLATVSLGLRVYREEHGGFPEGLGELSPGVLAEVPGDGFAGGPLRYRREGTGYVLYSVGDDGRDDGGVGREDRKAGGGVDIVVRGVE